MWVSTLRTDNNRYAPSRRVYPESQCGFRAERSTVYMVFFLRHLREKCRDQQMPLYIAFIDLTKAFDLVSRDGLFKVLPKIGCPPKQQIMIEYFHTDTKGTVQFNGSSLEPLEIHEGVKQGRVFFLFRVSSYQIVNSVCWSHALVNGSTSKTPASDGGLCRGQLLMMWSAICSGSPHSHGALSASPHYFMDTLYRPTHRCQPAVILAWFKTSVPEAYS